MTTHITQAQLKRLLHYDKKTGEFTWKCNRTRGLAGTKAGSINKFGYVIIKIDGKAYKAHRLAYLYVEGDIPCAVVDHINNNTSDNSWKNLRGCSHSSNMMNKSLGKNSSTGIKGVSYISSRDTYEAVLVHKGKRVLREAFKDINKAEQAVREAREKLHGEFCNHG